MKFVAPEQAQEQAEIIKNTPFWPDVDLSEFRSVMRTDGTVTSPRLGQLIRSAMSEVNAELYDFHQAPAGALGFMAAGRYLANCWTVKANVFTTTTTPFIAGHARR